MSSALEKAITLIGSVPGYALAAEELRELQLKGLLAEKTDLTDRAVTTWRGAIYVGPEALSDIPLGLAQTLIHELHHRHQFPFLKTISFWRGVFTGTPVWRHLERPAYQAAYDFLERFGTVYPEFSEVTRKKQREIQEDFAFFYGGNL